MTLEQLEETFEKNDAEYLWFGRISKKLSNRPDLHAFMLLDMLLPGDRDMISAAEHDEFWLDIDVEALAKIATEELIIDLIRCGIRYSEESLCMFA